jgi:hypothetical protein
VVKGNNNLYTYNEEVEKRLKLRREEVFGKASLLMRKLGHTLPYAVRRQFAVWTRFQFYKG